MEITLGVLSLVVTIITVLSGRFAAKNAASEKEREAYRKELEELRRKDKAEVYQAIRVVEMANVATNNTVTNHIAYVQGRDKNERSGDKRSTD